YPQQQNHFSFRNCLFSNNSSPGGDVGGIVSICSSNNPRIDISNCTFAGNQGDAYTLQTNGDVSITNSIFYNDTPYQIKVEPMNGDPNEHTHLTIDHSLVKDGISGILPFPVPGNTINFLPSSISDNPLFTGGFIVHDPLNYRLTALSPCINTGTLDTLGLFLPPYDLAGNQRVWDGRIDMGCLEFGSEPYVGNEDPSTPVIPAASISAYPNPFAAFTNLRVSLPSYGRGGTEPVNAAHISIYNIKGQLVKTIALDPHNSGEQFSYWDGRDTGNLRCSSGIYLMSLVVDGVRVSSKKVTLLR
ncbi:MAG TPA: FlgD immunoglobulin-like domain containing protein, partial [Candidatus Cloacimonadota bacterium]|nr:FlgD immunoglobulin-like domain containing protein [Candidatus Cloacimonadota bacterium]